MGLTSIISNNMNIKPILSSWTIWYGILQVALGIVGWISGKMDPTAAQTLIITGAGTIGFRFKTTDPII